MVALAISPAMNSLEDAFKAFCQHYPEYEATRSLDDLRTREYSRLDRLGHVYLDYTGGNLYAETQLDQHMDILKNNVFGNPHSENPTSLAMTRLVEGARAFVLEYFHASPDEYVVIFTPNSTGALKIVGESYPFDSRSRYLLTYDNHNSVNGIREYAHSRGAEVIYAPMLPPDLRVDEEKLLAALEQVDPEGHNLFAYPAQSNFSGVQHPLTWINRAQAKGWDVLLDAAAFVPSSRLNLSRWKPDFVDISFYKMFGYPTGIGALIARKSALNKLQRPWYAGGTVTCASVQGEGRYLTPGSAGFEDGTVNYLGIPAIEIGLRYLQSVGIEKINARVKCLTGWLLEALTSLQHSNGRPLLRVYGPTTTMARGGTVEVNYYDPDGVLIDCHRVEALANSHNISLRAGCHCNPGAGEISMGITLEFIQQCLLDGKRMTYDEFSQIVGERAPGAVRASMGIASNFADVYRYYQFAQSLLDQPASAFAK